MGAAIVGALLGPVLGGDRLGDRHRARVRERRRARVRARRRGLARRRPRTPGSPQPLSRLVGALRDRAILAALWFVLLPALLFGVLSVLGPLRLDELGFGALAIGATWLVAASFEATLAPLIGPHLRPPRHASPPLRVGLVGSAAARRVAAVARPRLGCSPRPIVLAALAFGSFWTPAMSHARRRGRGDRARLRLRVRADQPRLGAGTAAGAALGGAAARATSDAAVYLALSALCVVTSSCSPRLPALWRIRKLLVANRGEIALRVFRTCRELGDGHGGRRAAGRRRLAARPLGRRDGRDRVLPRVRGAHPGGEASGRRRVHPGYGFLAENADFADAVEAAGLTWIGPPPEALRAGGDKLAAKEIAREAGVPVVPDGRPGRDRLPAAREGGGGRRRTRHARRSRAASELDEALAAARREAKAAFGDDRVFPERYLERPRHVEIQLLADAHGTVVSLGERECSIQRRHQKVLEESPSPALDPALRAPMSEAAVAFARAIGYRGAGTAEFLLDGRRLLLPRAERPHPGRAPGHGARHRARPRASEQLRIAAGEPLDAPGGEPDGPRRRGAALRGGSAHVPAAGRPDSSACGCPRAIRVDAGVEEGDEVGSRYDPMIAKLIAHGADARRGARPPRRRARGDGGRGRDHEPPVPALARRAPGRASGRDDDRVPRRAPAALRAARCACRAAWRGAWRLNLPAPAPAARPTSTRRPRPPPRRVPSRARSPRRCRARSSACSSPPATRSRRASRSSCWKR